MIDNKYIHICYDPNSPEATTNTVETTEQMENTEAKADAGFAKAKIENTTEAGNKSINFLKKEQMYDKSKGTEDRYNLYAKYKLDINTVNKIDKNIGNITPEKTSDGYKYQFDIRLRPNMTEEEKNNTIQTALNNIDEFSKKFNVKPNTEGIKKRFEEAKTEINSSADVLARNKIITPQEAQEIKEGRQTQECKNKIKNYVDNNKITLQNRALKDGVNNKDSINIAVSHLFFGVPKSNIQEILLEGNQLKSIPEKPQPTPEKKEVVAQTLNVSQGFKQAESSLSEEKLKDITDQVTKLSNPNIPLSFSASVDSDPVRQETQPKIEADLQKLQIQLQTSLDPTQAQNILGAIGNKINTDYPQLDQGNKILLANRALSVINAILDANSQQKIDVNAIQFKVNEVDRSKVNIQDENQRGASASINNPQNTGNSIASNTASGNSNKPST